MLSRGDFREYDGGCRTGGGGGGGGGIPAYAGMTGGGVGHDGRGCGNDGVGVGYDGMNRSETYPGRSARYLELEYHWVAGTSIRG